MYSFGNTLLDAIQKEYVVKQDKANWVSSLNTGFIFLSGPAVAGFANKFGIRPVIMVGGIGASAVYVLSQFSPNIYAMMFCYGVLGGMQRNASGVKHKYIFLKVFLWAARICHQCGWFLYISARKEELQRVLQWLVVV